MEHSRKLTTTSKVIFCNINFKHSFLLPFYPDCDCPSTLLPRLSSGTFTSRIMTRENEMYFILSIFLLHKFSYWKWNIHLTLCSLCVLRQEAKLLLINWRLCPETDSASYQFLLQLLRFLLACKLTLSRAVTTTASAKGLTDRWITCNRNTLLVFTVFVPLSQNAAGSVFLNSCFSGVCTVI